ncbi:hypothetical protein O185_02565 [Photorhabdus temperata J3]|uniref:Uncharacterized protein n=1 Tax=Photorhabdus temperata J3 TaxID=1389415 RepID=U7R3T2_PHOTE|nr:hypothetical protein O185_02565 [Photorhabdus temperata J3]
MKISSLKNFLNVVPDKPKQQKQSVELTKNTFKYRGSQPYIAKSNELLAPR